MEKAQEWNKEALVHFLETAPLYTSIEFEGKSIPNFDNLEEVISELSYYCPQCKEIRLFHTRIDSKFLAVQRGMRPPYALPTGYLCYSLYCSKNVCGLNKRVYLYYERKEDNDNSEGAISHVTLTKCGEYPSMPPRVDEAILKVFPNDAELLKKAVKCLRTGYGVGAFAYLRQVLENRIDVIISEIRKNAEEQGDAEAIKKLNELGATSPESEKIKIAKDALPANLQSKGHNPLGLLYKTLSEGIHGLSDSECLGKANAIYGALTYILKTLAVNSASRKEYEASLKFLSK